MASSSAADPAQNPTGPASKTKKNKRKKKSPPSKQDTPSTTHAVNGTDHEGADEGDEDEEPQSPVEDATEEHGTGSVDNGANGASQTSQPTSTKTPTATETMSDDPTDRLNTLAKERDDLRAEVSEMRKSLEIIQSQHEEDTASLKEQLEDAQTGKEHADTQYKNLLGKVNTIRSQLGERLKQDAEELGRARTQLDELEEQRRGLEEQNESLLEDVEQLRKTNEQASEEISNLRSRSNMSQQNWVQERDDLIRKEAFVRDEFENARQAMQDWEVLAMEERSLRENLSEKVTELEDQLSTTREAYESVSIDRNSQVSKLDTLQRRIQEEHDARKKELRELVEQSHAQLEDLRKQLHAAESVAAESKSTLETTQKELERALPFEKEVKEKNLLIGKVRHECVILNDHLKKALRMLKKGKAEDNVDKTIVTSYFLQFLALDRSDPKKFEILQLIASLLNWTDEQREQAGLARPGASNTSLRIPLSPFRRTPSTPALNADTMLMSDHGASKESLAELWSSFLEQQALEGSPGPAKQPSVTSPASEGTPRGRGTSPGLGIS